MFKYESIKLKNTHLKFRLILFPPGPASCSSQIHLHFINLISKDCFLLQKIKFYKKPDPYIILTVGDNQTKSRRRRHTCDPTWEQGFYLLVKNPETDSLIITVMGMLFYSLLIILLFTIYFQF